MADPMRPRSWLVTAVLAAMGLLILVAHSRLYYPFFSDDALISLRYAERLLAGHGLTWNDGERVEGYSNLLWVLGVAGVGRLGVGLVDAARLLGLLGMSAVVGALAVARPLRSWGEGLRALPAMLVPGLCGSLAAWAIGGLEQPMLAGLLAWALVLSYRLLETPSPTRRQLLAPGLLFGLLCLTRPDGPLFVVAVAGALVLVRGPHGATLRTGAWLALPSVLLYGGQLAFRLAYYGEWVPNTALVKIALTPSRLLGGWSYLSQGMIAFWPLLALVGGLGVLAARRREPLGRLTLLGTTLGVWSAYVVFIGGDIFPAHRHLVPSLVVLALMVAEGLRLIEGASARTRRATVAASIALLVGLVIVQRRDPENYRAASELWEWEGKAIATALGTGFAAQQPLMAVTAAGCLPYWSKLPSLDLLGLNDHHIPRHPPKGFGSGFLGHELGDARYVLGRAPDMVIFGGPRGGARPHFFADRQLAEDAEFQQRYAMAYFEASDPVPVRSGIWLRIDSARVGIRRSGAAVTVPAYLFNGNPATTARLDASGRFVVSVSRAAPAVLPSLGLAPGAWRLRLDPPDGAWRVSAKGMAEAVGAEPVLTLGHSDVRDLTLVPLVGQPRPLREVRFERD